MYKLKLLFCKNFGSPERISGSSDEPLGNPNKISGSLEAASHFTTGVGKSWHLLALVFWSRLNL